MNRFLRRLAFSLGTLAGLLWLVDTDALAARLSGFHGGWVALALVVSVPQVALSAYRWRFTAERLGVRLPYAAALREYYIGTFLNQVVPGGIAGDVSRAWRHARGADRTSFGVAARAVILERISGQLVFGAVALASLAVLPLAVGPRSGLALVALAVIGGVAAAGVAARRKTGAGALRSIWSDLHTALLSRGAMPTQLSVSSLVVASYILTYFAAARAVGIDTPAVVLLPLIGPVLMSMLMPMSIAGWGVREAAAAALWSAAGLGAAEGMAISVAYGLLMLLASLPGAAVLSVAGSPKLEVEEDVVAELEVAGAGAERVA